MNIEFAILIKKLEETSGHPKCINLGPKYSNIFFLVQNSLTFIGQITEEWKTRNLVPASTN